MFIPATFHGFSPYKQPPRKGLTGKMGRTLHYQTKEAVTAEELKQLKEIKNKYNRGHEWVFECIKLWKKSHIWNAPVIQLDGSVKKRSDSDNALWGFTKVNSNDEDGKLVIKAIKEMSRITPRLTWILSDEGGLLNSRKIVIKKGKVLRR